MKIFCRKTLSYSSDEVKWGAERRREAGAKLKVTETEGQLEDLMQNSP